MAALTSVRLIMCSRLMKLGPFQQRCFMWWASSVRNKATQNQCAVLGQIHESDKWTKQLLCRLYSSERKYEIVDDSEDYKKEVFQLIYLHGRKSHLWTLNFVFSSLAVNFTFVLCAAIAYDAFYGHLSMNESLKEFVIFTVSALSTHVVMATRKPLLEMYFNGNSREIMVVFLTIFGMRKERKFSLKEIEYKKGTKNADLVKVKGRKDSWLVFYGHGQDAEKLRQNVRRKFKVR